MATMQQIQNRVIPFRMGTRQRSQPIPIQSGGTFTEGGSFSATLPAVGFLSGVWVKAALTLTTSDVAALKLRGPWDIIKRLRLELNVGSTVIYNTSGYGNFFVQRTRCKSFVPTANSAIYLAPVAKGANTWLLWYYIPVSINRGENFDIGLINLQSPQVVCTLSGDYNTGLAVATLVTAVTGTITAEMEYYQLPDSQQVEYPPLLFHRIIETPQVISAVGDQTVLIPREGVLQRIGHIFQGNDALDDTVDTFRLIFNKSDYVYRRSRGLMQYLQHLHFGALGTQAAAVAGGLPAGWYLWEFEGAFGSGESGYGDQRDWIDSEALSTLESVADYQGAVAGTVNRVDTIREFVQGLRQ